MNNQFPGPQCTPGARREAAPGGGDGGQRHRTDVEGSRGARRGGGTRGLGQREGIPPRRNNFLGPRHPLPQVCGVLSNPIYNHAASFVVFSGLLQTISRFPP